MGMVRFSQIHPRAFAHPFDQKATSTFQKLPLLPELLRKISELRLEEKFRAEHMHSSIQVGRCQLPSVWRIVHEVAERLSITPPRTYITRKGGANAFVFGKSSPSIVLTSGLIDLMSDRELEGIIAHEMGHILCQHLLYMDVGHAMTSHAVPLLQKVPGLQLGFQVGVASAFFAWFRAAEYSADRAGLLILEDPDPLAMALSRLAGLPRRFEEEFDLRVFAEQVKNYSEEATLWSKIMTFGMDSFLTHPEPAKRVLALLEWADSDEYRAILNGRYLTKFEVESLAATIQIEGVRSCPLCRSAVGDAPFCPNPDCGLEQDPSRQQLCPNLHAAGIDWKFCIACGATLTQGATSSEIPGS
jgi:Zn-dependent protease with chaperone function